MVVRTHRKRQPKKLGGVPMVRIHLPPAGSQERTVRLPAMEWLNEQKKSG
jgi:hypothetical protein